MAGSPAKSTKKSKESLVKGASTIKSKSALKSTAKSGMKKVKLDPTAEKKNE